MAGGLLQSTSFPWAVSSENNIRSKQSCNTKRAVKMMCSLQLQSPPMRLRTFSGLRGVKALDKIVKRRHDFHSGEGEREEEEEEEEEDEGEEEEEDEGEDEDEDWRTIEQREAMFKRFTKDAKKVIEAAEEEARRLDQKFVGAELIFLGLIAGEDYDTAAKVLKSMGINLEDARAQVEEIVGRGSGPESADQLSFTPRANHLFELSLEEARQLGHSYIDTEHLLLGLLRAGEGVNLILRNLGAYPHDIRTQVIRMVDKSEDTVDGYNKTPTLAKYGINLTILSDDLHPVVGMQPLISRVIQIFKKHTKNNPCLIGEPGVGKTSIAQGFAQSIQGFYINPKVISLDMRQLVQVGFEERLNKLMDELKLSGRRLILFIDDIHTLFEAGAAEGVVAAANFLKQALATGFQCIGATTPDGYRKHMENDPTLEGLFQPIKVPEPTVAETIMILRGIRERYENHHGLSYTNEALIAAAQLSNEYISDGFLPGKAINLIDEAGSFVACKNQLRDLYDRQLREELERVRMLRLMTKEDIGALSDKDLERVGMLWDLEMDCMIRISEIEKRIEEIKRTPSEDLLVTEADIKEVVSSGIFTSKNYL